uniref:Integrase, catalytic region, zinc finger, CCHC-type, peptidase aspartic, catalytic n=1 Tax=Tanacetum cinerariifolium TaxID=118510 RepID=A0A699GG84_TANCI|nr:integrase, catalytic region, zinc finger, CCHC-type, peptidase aspartic, catalytic [Tanacetum cinerariifolium]
MQTQTSNTLHNAIMKAGSKDRPPLLAPGNYVQWKSRIKRYIDTKPNHELIHHCLKNPPYKFTWADKEVPISEGSPVTRTESSLQAATRNKGKAIVNSPQPIYDQEPSMVTEDDETSKDKEIDKLMALISLSFKKIYKPTNNNLQTSSNNSRANQDNSPRINRSTGYENQRIGNVAGARETVGSTVVQKSGIQCYNCKEFRHVARECHKPKRVKDAAYHREKMLLCKQEEAGIQLNAEQADWRDDTDDDELQDQELEAHYMYMVQLQKVSPDAADSGPIFDAEPLEKVSNDDHYNVFAIESEHPEQSKFFHDTYPIEQDAHNVIIDSLDMSYDREEIDQNDYNNDLDNECELLASLIEKLKYEIDERKNRNKFFETSNKKEAQIKLYKTREDKELDKVIALENKVKVLDNIVYKTGQLVQTMNMLNNKCRTSFAKPEFLKKAQRANPRLYDIDEVTNLQCDYLELLEKCECLEKDLSKSKMMSKSFEALQKQAINLEIDLQQYLKAQLQDKGIVISDLKKLIAKLKGKSVDTKFDKSSVIRQPNAFKSQRPSVLGKPTIFSNSLERKDFSKSNLNAKILNVNFVCATCGKCVLNDKYEMCVLNYVAKPLKKTVASESNQKLKNTTRKLYEYLVEIVLFIVDSGCSKHMTGNLKLLINFVEKFLGTVKFRNDQISLILGYGDLVQGAVMIKRGNDLLIGSHGTDLYSITLQDTNCPNPICLMAKATSSQAWLWHRRLSHLNFDTINLLSKNDIVTLHAYFAAEGIHHQTDGENLDKIKEKGDACIFVGYSTQSRGYRVFNKRTRVIVETIHVNFDELPHTASDHVSSDPVLECPTTALEHDSLSPSLQCHVNVTQADRTVTTSNELDLLFSLMFDELLNGSSQVVSKSSVVTTADTPNQSEMVKEYAQIENDEFINIFCTPVQDRGETSSRHVDSSNMHTFYQHHPSEHRWAKDHPLEQVIGNPSQSVRTRRQLESDGEIYHFIKEKVEKGIVELFFVETEYQLADLFTKALPEERFKYLIRRHGMRCLTPEELEVLANESA